MNRPQPPARVPTLTEVIALEAATEAPVADRGGVGVALASEPRSVDEVWAQLKPWLDAEWEQRVQAALDPAVQSLHDALLVRLRCEFEPLLKEALRRALPQVGPRAEPD